MQKLTVTFRKGESSRFLSHLDLAATLAGIPCLAGAPFGHIADQWTIPLGAIAELDSDARTLRVLSGT